VHAIGGGIVLCEIQQNSDVTYRLWDYGRLRELHVDQAVAIADLGVHPGASQPVPTGAGRQKLVQSKFFVTELVSGVSLIPEPQPCQIWICIEGDAQIGGEAVRAGDVWLFPDAGQQPAVNAETARFLRTYIPGNTL
jgi:mannose-6-phosphate isomerase